MSTREPDDELGPEALEPLFAMGRRKPTVAILVLLVLIAVLGTVAGAVVNEPEDIAPHVPSRGTGERVLLPGGLNLALASLGQIPTKSVPPAQDTGSANAVKLGPGDDVTINVPDGWTVLAEDSGGAFAFFQGPDGTAFGAELVNVDPLTPGSDLLATAVDDVLATERYTRRHLTDLQTRIPFGDLVSWAITGYSAIRTDLQGAQSVGGNLSVYVRQDGLALILNTEVSPVGNWDGAVQTWESLFTDAAESFAKHEFP